MKSAAFATITPATLPGAIAALANATPIAGGQSLGPMLNLRAARPASIIALHALPELHGTEDTPTAITLGALTTHAAIADGRTPDLPGNILATIAAGIAYRAVRTRGTIGGSLCHADPAADWLTTLMALDAVALTTTRAIPVDAIVTGPYQTVLAPGELLRAVRIPRPGPNARWGYQKLCRKPGEFAHAMAAVLIDGPNLRLAIGATGSRPILLKTIEAADAALATFPPVDRALHHAAIRRALDQADA